MKKVWHSRGKLPSRDYFRKRYGNPLFGDRGRSKRNAVGKIAWKTLVAILVAGLFGGAGWYFGWSDSFRVTDVTVAGATPATEETIRGIVAERLAGTNALMIPRQNIFAFDVAAAQETIEERFFFQTLSLRKQLPHTLIIEIAERDTKAVLLADGQFLAVDGSGFLTRQLSEAEIRAIAELPPDYSSVLAQSLGAESMEIKDAPRPDATRPAARNRNALPLFTTAPPTGSKKERGIGDVAASPSAVSLMLQAYARLPDIVGGGVRWFEVDENVETVRAIIEGDWGVFFSTALPFDPQAQRLLLVLKEKIGARRAELEYVDLRYNERIFFRFKEAAEPKE